MSPRIPRAALAAIAFVALAAEGSTGAAQTPAPDAETAQKFASFATSPAYFGFLQERLPQLEPAPLRAACSDIKPIQRKRLALIATPVFVGDAKQPSGGAWIDQLRVSRCGTETVRTLVISVKDANLQLAALLPGETVTAITLQRDAAPAAEERAKQKTSCAEKMQVVDTRVEGEVKPGAPWQETWTLQGCGAATADIGMTFTPDGQGGVTFAAAAK